MTKACDSRRGVVETEKSGAGIGLRYCFRDNGVWYVTVRVDEMGEVLFAAALLPGDCRV